METKISKIITGSPVGNITIGERAIIRQADGFRHTTPVIDVRRMSASEIRFETRNTKYVLRVAPVHNNFMEAVKR